MLHLLCWLLLMIPLRQNLKGMQLSLKQWQYKLLQKLDHLLWVSLWRKTPTQFLSCWPARISPVGRQEVQELKNKEFLVLELELKELEVHELEV